MKIRIFLFVLLAFIGSYSIAQTVTDYDGNVYHLEPFNMYDIDQFEIEFQKYFIIKEKHLLKNSQRTVYLMIKKGL